MMDEARDISVSANNQGRLNDENVVEAEVVEPGGASFRGGYAESSRAAAPPVKRGIFSTALRVGAGAAGTLAVGAAFAGFFLVFIALLLPFLLILPFVGGRRVVVKKFFWKGPSGPN